MTLDVTLPILVRSAGPALFMLTGIALGALSRGRADRVALGLFFACFGAWLVASNLGIAGGGSPFFVAALVLVVAATCAGILSLMLLPRTHRPGAATLAALGALMIALSAIFFHFLSDLLPRSAFAQMIPAESFGLFATYVNLAVPMLGLLLTLPIAWALVALRAPGKDIEAWAGLATGILVFMGFTTGTDILSGLNIVLIIHPETSFVMILAGAAFWLLVAARRNSIVARNVALAGLVATLAGMAWHAATGIDSVYDPVGAVGLARLVGWAIIVVTLARAGWLDSGFLPRHRAGVAATSLATLFVIAQVAENYLGAKYGLVLGSVVAGTFLFAAHPVQRAMERIMEGNASSQTRPSGGTPASSVGDAKYAAYRRAVRLALRDRVLSQEEEIELAYIAHEIGLTPMEAIRIRHDVERETVPPGPADTT